MRYLEFESHYMGVWGVTKMSAVLGRLQSWGFVCYWAGRNRLWRITGFWDPRYDDHKRWANVVCVQRADKWLPVLESFRATL